MKKVILSVVAVGALVVGGVARADVIDSVGNAISNLTGIPYYPVPNAVPVPAAPVAVVPAAPVAVVPSAPVAMANGIYTDAYGRQYQVDAYGRYVPLDQYGSYVDQWGRTVYLGANNQPLYIQQDGQLIPYGGVAIR